MGIDAEGWFKTPEPVTKEWVSELNAKIAYAFHERGDWLHGPNSDGSVVINFDLCRYWGPGYERGIFSNYANILGFLLRNLPEGSEIRYDGDCSDSEDHAVYNLDTEKLFLEKWFKDGCAPYRR